MKPQKTTVITITLALAIATLAVGCAVFGQNSRHHASSVMQYLYPKDNEHVDVPAIPILSLPLKVGVAFVPENNADRHGNIYIPSGNSPFDEEQKMKLMKQVSDNFKKYPFVQSIELIPSAYLTPKGGFANVDQLRRMFGVDVIVLLAYDQVQFTDEGFLSLTYWTVVGAWVIQGERNETKTMMDAVVYDITSRKLLFRAPGTSQVKASSTPINLTEELRRDSEMGLKIAATNLVSNLQEQLALFKEHVKDSPDDIKIVTKPGYTGAGALGGLDVLLVAGLGAFSLWSRKNKS